MASIIKRKKSYSVVYNYTESHQDELKGLLGDEYTDYNLVVALNNGRPCEGRVLLKAFEALREKIKRDKVVIDKLFLNNSEL